jgi:hypothetical protein
MLSLSRLSLSRLSLVGLLAAASGIVSTTAFAQTGYTISGYMSNFDCTNRCDYECDELEVQIEGIRPADIIHTYMNGNYGLPTVTLSADGTYTSVDYRNPHHLTAVGSIEHFGITIRGAVYYGPAPEHVEHVHWYRNGHIATVNGQLPTENGGTAPATQPIQPSISAGITPGSHGNGGVNLRVKNNDPVQSIWIKRRAQITASPVSLEALMPNDPVVTTSVQIDASPILVAPLQVLTLAHDLFDVEEEQSAVFAAEYFQNVRGAGPFNQNQNAPGPLLGNVMTATQASPQLPCAHSIPTVVSQPASVTQAANSRVDLRVTGRGDDLSPLTYEWMKEGVALAEGNGISGTTTNHLRIDHLTAATEGFYAVRITNTCASIVSDSALVFITGHNTSPVHVVECPAMILGPESMTGCASGPNTMTMYASGTGPLSYQWQLVGNHGQAGGTLSNGLYIDRRSGVSFLVSGAITPELSISNVSTDGSGGGLDFVAKVSNTCGNVTSPSATLSLCACLECPADFNQDGGVDGTDVNVFFDRWQAGNCDADVNYDGGVDGDDVAVFFAAWEAGGC